MLARFRALADFRQDLLWWREGRAAPVVVHVEAVHADTTAGRRIARTQFGAFAERPTAGFVALLCSAVGSAGPAPQGWEDVAQKGPDKRDVGDEDGHGGLTEVPVHVNVGDQTGDETVDFGEDGSDDNEDTHAENEQEDQLLLKRHADFQKERNGDDKHEDIGADGDASLDDFVILIGRALI